MLRILLYLPSNSISVRAAFAALWIGLCVGVGATPAAAAETGTIRGVVVDTAGGAAIRDVSVRLQSSGHAVVTDDEGRFEFHDVPAGDQQLYVSAVDFILVKRAVSVAANGTADITIALSEGTGAYTESVDVHARLPMTRREPAVAAEQTLGSRELLQLRGTLTNDPLRAVQSLPAVAAGDDFRSEFAVRGAGVDRMAFTFEGIATPFLLHTVQQVHDSGSVAMLNGDVLDEITLLNGAYPQRHGNRTGAEVDFRMREGSRSRIQSHLSVSAVDSSGVVEGPLGSAKKGSWLFSIRKSYLDMVVSRLYPDMNLSFGFTDAQAKVAYDVTSRHQVQFAMTTGTSQFRREPTAITAGTLRDADNQSTMAVTTWRYLPSQTFTISQRVAVIQNTFKNLSRDSVDLDSGDAHDLVYRADVTAAPRANVLFESGGETRWSSGVGREQRLSGGRFQQRESFDSHAFAASIYGQARISSPGGGAGWSIAPGLRVDRFSLVDRTAASPWIQAMLPLTGRLTLRGGTGVHRQEPGFVEVLGSHGTLTLRAERAYHTDIGVEGRVGSAGRWQMTVYDREDRDLLRLPYTEPRVVDGVLVNGLLTSHYLNALDGHARGVEFLLQRQATNGFAGWVSYALGFATYHDRTTNEEFAGDYDQRHTVNLYGTYRVSERMSLSARFRAGSNFPTTGYWAERDGAYLLGADRNTLSVPAYARLDARANRTFAWSDKRLTLFLEAINVLGRRNVRYALPSINRRTFEATGLYERMVPRIPSVGVLLEF